MLVLNLACAGGHGFEGWFGSAEDFESQRKGGLVSCPICADAEIQRMPSAPRINIGAVSQQEPSPERIRQALKHLRNQSEDVGPRFAEEARRIHQGDAPERAIRGQASAEETRELLEDGVPVLPLPALDDSLH